PRFAPTFLHAVPGSRQLRLGGAQPVLPVLCRAPAEPLEDVLPILWRLGVAALRADFQLAQSCEHGFDRLFGVQEELAAAHAEEAPAEPLEDGLPRHVLAQLLLRRRLVTVALDGQAAPSTLDDQVDGVVPAPPVRPPAIAG